MKTYHNVMEDVVEAQLDEMKDTLDCCMCEQCRGDIIAYSLNQLPPRYVMTTAGQLIVRVDNLRMQSLADVRTALIKGAMLVKEHPRH